MRPEGSALLKGGLNRTLGVRHDAGDRTFCDAIKLITKTLHKPVIKDPSRTMAPKLNDE
jgi:hypothetical protein